MRNFTGNGYGNTPRNSRELLLARLSKSFPDRLSTMKTSFSIRCSNTKTTCGNATITYAKTK